MKALQNLLSSARRWPDLHLVYGLSNLEASLLMCAISPRKASPQMTPKEFIDFSGRYMGSARLELLKKLALEVGEQGEDKFFADLAKKSKAITEGMSL